MRTKLFLFTALTAAVLFPEARSAPIRPNILWITAEDMSATLGCYGDPYAHTPNIDRLARQSVRYTRAFATAPVCSPSRSCLITGCYAPSLGTQQMRSAFPIPDLMTGFPSLLRKAGFYTSNKVKTDYNTANWKEVIAASWDDSSDAAHFRKRSAGKPFFSVFNLMTSHQSRTMVWPYEKFQAEVQSRLTTDEIHDPAKAPLPPYYPDTPVIRKTVARFYDCVTAMDKEVGEILGQLDEDGLTEDTIVFFYSDHGSGMPRHKRALFDSGTHVPLLIRFPEKFRHLAPAKPGESVGNLVSFVDFGPTALALAGLKVPKSMQGQPFLGQGALRARQYVHGHRDRVDEVRDLARSVRDERFLYIRNYLPHLGYNQPTGWPDLGEIRHEFYRLTDPKKMTPAQWQFAGPTRPVEELYDTRNDPQNLNNLANAPKFANELKRLRAEHQRHIAAARDLGFVPESEAWRISDKLNPWDAARAGKIDLSKIHSAAWQVGTADEKAFLRNMRSDNASIRYWGVIGLAALEQTTPAASRALAKALTDKSSAVRIEAAGLLARAGDPAALALLEKELQSEDMNAVLHGMRAIELLGAKARTAIPAVKRLLARCNELSSPDLPPTIVLSGPQDLAVFTRLSIGGFLSRVDHPKERALFDGKTLHGWSARAKGDVQVVDGEIQILARGDNLWLVHEEDFTDFELTVEAMMPADGKYNSGIGFRCVGEGKPKGYQCEIEEAKSGMLYAIGSGWVWPKGAEESKAFAAMTRNAFKTGDWNRFRIRCEGERIQIWLNDVQTADLRDTRFTRGNIALQHHGKGDLHRFRNITIRPLP
jgi:N-sulfoglucosamine sulfohydrolase